MSDIVSVTILEENHIVKKIHWIRQCKVMIDSDLAELYGVETKVLKQAVKRNLLRFPSDFMFELTKEEFDHLRSQFVTSSDQNWGGSRYLPMAFTEQGLAMLASILKSETAINVHIKIIRVFTKLRSLLSNNKDILLQLNELGKKVDGHDENIQVIFEYLRKMIQEPEVKRARIGFRRKDELT